MRRLIVCVVVMLAAPAWAVNTSHWVHTSEADFKKGTFKNVVATNLGDVKLSRAVKTILEQDPKVSAVYCLAEGPDGVIYAGTGPHGVLLRVKGEQVSKVFEPDGVTNISALLVDEKGRVLVGTGGDKGQVLRIDRPGEKDAKPVEVFSEKDVQYVWAIVQTPDGNLYAGTGPNGQIFEIKPDGEKSVLLDSDENNVLSLISDGKDLLYAGTDPNGLVYRINRKTREVFVVFDAPESEISALALDARGNLYAGTAEASEKQPEAPGTPGGEGAKEKGGRPEGTGGVPIPAQPPENPKPPAVPEPNPGEPNPIPKKAVFNDRDVTGPVYLAVGGWERVLKL
jgi:WD40 repeat protein